MAKKNNILWIALSLICVVVFNVIVFLITSNFTSTFWVSYGFIHFAYIMFVVSYVTVPKVKNSVVLGYPLIYLSYLYFIVEFIIGVMFIYYKDVNLNVALIPQIIITGLYGISYIANLIANENTMINEEISQKELSYIKNAVSELYKLMNQIDDVQFKKNLEKLYDDFRSSQVKSHESLAGTEKRLISIIEELKYEVLKKDYDKADKLIYKANLLLLERNEMIKTIQ